MPYRPIQDSQTQWILITNMCVESCYILLFYEYHQRLYAKGQESEPFHVAWKLAKNCTHVKHIITSPFTINNLLTLSSIKRYSSTFKTQKFNLKYQYQWQKKWLQEIILFKSLCADPEPYMFLILIINNQKPCIPHQSCYVISYINP